MKPPIVSFTPFHPSRVEPLRNWRERDLREVPKKGRKIILDKAPSKPRAKKADKAPVLPAGLDAQTQLMVLEALKKLRR